MKQQITREILNTILEAQDIETLSLDQITDYFLGEETIAKYAPDGVCQIDPRNGDRIIFNTARAKRPHDNQPTDIESDHLDNDKGCLICQGKTTNVVDVRNLSEGFTFINKNLFPIFYPSNKEKIIVIDDEYQNENAGSCRVRGYHFLQWTSSHHDKDWHNMPLDDRVIVMRRLAALERKMLIGSDKFVSIIKNYGHLVGGSIVHGHQQIGVSNIMPNRCRQNKQFQDRHGETFSAYLLRKNSQEFVIKDYGTAVLITPYFMRRPHDMFLILKDTSKSYFHMLNSDEYADISNGWQDAIRIMRLLMPQVGREIAYNVTSHNGPGAGLHFEFLPYTQEMGGFEHLGLYLCQGNPQAAASFARDSLLHF